MIYLMLMYDLFILDSLVISLHVLALA